MLGPFKQSASTTETPAEAKDRRAGKLQLILVGAFVVGAFAISMALQSSYTPPGQNAPEERLIYVETQDITSRTHRVQFSVTGVVEARSSVRIVPEVRGRVLSVHPAFYAGGVFETGETLFQIDPRDFDIALKQRQADVARAQTALELARAEAQAAVAEWRLNQGNRPAPALVARRPQVAEAQATLKAAKASREEAALNLERTKFTLPFRGRVVSSTIAEGQFVQAGQAYGEVFDAAALEIQVSLTDQQLTWLLATETPQSQITTTYLGETLTHPGVLQRAAASIDRGTRFATVRFAFADPQPDIVPGVFAEVAITGQALENVMVLPLSAVQESGTVWLVQPDSTVRAWQPEVIYRDTTSVLVPAHPDTTAVQVVSSRLAGAYEGMRVTLQEAADAADPGDSASLGSFGP